MKNKKLTIALTATGLASATLVSLFAINKVIGKIATSKDLLNTRNKEIFNWRFGDISYSVTGEGKPVLLIHNLKEDSSSIEWSQIIPELSMNHTVYTIDLLGCGLSDRPDMICTSFMYTQLVSDFVRDVIKKKTNIVVTGKSAAFVRRYLERSIKVTSGNNSHPLALHILEERQQISIRMIVSSVFYYG